MIRDPDLLFFAWLYEPDSKRSRCDAVTVLSQYPVGRQVVEGNELVAVPDRKGMAAKGFWFYLDPLIGMFKFGVMGLRRPVREDYAFMNKIMVVGCLAKTAAEGDDVMVRITVIVDALVLPFPDGASQQGRIFIQQMLI